MLYKATALDERASELSEKYFDDMSLKKGSIVENFFLLKYEDGHTEYDLSYEMSNTVNANNYQYVVGTLENAAGETNHTKHTITIAPEYIHDDVILLHEIIHVFEGLYSLRDPYENHFGDQVEPCVYPFIRDALLICLYNDLKTKIPDLDSRIIAHANIYSGVEIANQGGNHDILFYLKSLDLDLRLGYPLGTICGYGRDEYKAKNMTMEHEPN